MKIKQKIIYTLFAILSFSMIPLSQVGAETCGSVELKNGQKCCNGVVTSLVSCEESGDGLENTGLWKLLLIAINILTGGIAIAAVGGFIYGAILYSSAGGSSDNIKKAKAIFMNIVIGIVMYVLMYSFLNYLIPGGIFNKL